MHIAPCNVHISQSFLLPPPPECLRALYTLRSVQQLCSCLNNPSLFEPGCCVLLCTWLVLPLCHRLLNRVSSVVRWPLPLPALLSAGQDSASWLSTPGASCPARRASVFLVLQIQPQCAPRCSPLPGCVLPQLPGRSLLPEPHRRADLNWRPSYCAPLQGLVAWSEHGLITVRSKEGFKE